MCKHHAGRSALHCILPPYILKAIVENGSQDQRVEAAKALSLDHTMRFMRATVARGRRGATLFSVQADGVKDRTIMDAAGAENLKGKVVRAEGDPATADVAVNEAYDGLGATWDFFWDVYHRDSIDDEGLPLKAVVHFGKDYDNAFWNGAQMVFGDGDRQLFNRFTIALDVIGHELAHGVTEDESGLQYANQSGALNESISDVFGSLVKQYALKHTADKADWLIGAGLLTKAVKGKALRSMKAPGTAYNDPVLGKDPQPAHMKSFVRTMQDNGGVHINSGIPNKAFYLAATALGGFAWEKAGRIWYETLRDSKLKPNATFRTFARLTVSNAARLYGNAGAEVKAVTDAWTGVGVATN